MDTKKVDRFFIERDLSSLANYLSDCVSSLFDDSDFHGHKLFFCGDTYMFTISIDFIEDCRYLNPNLVILCKK